MGNRELYNAELKERFMSERATTKVSRSLFVNVFEYVAPFEREYDADICTWDEDRLRPVLEKLVGFRSYSGKNRENLLKRYIKWCFSVGVPNASSSIFGVNVDGLNRVREMLVSGPEHLQRCLNVFLTPESDKTADNILRGYCWLAFSGMNDDEIIEVRKSDVDLQNLCVHSNGREFPLYRESLPCIRNLRDLPSFKYFHEGYTDEFVWRFRPEGDKLLRGIRTAEPSLYNIRSRLSNKSSEAFNAGKTDIKISYFRVWLSGEFYRMYQNERMGEQVDFTYLAKRAMLAHEARGKSYKLESENNKRTPESKLREIARNYQDDYARWKIVYSP